MKGAKCHEAKKIIVNCITPCDFGTAFILWVLARFCCTCFCSSVVPVLAWGALWICAPAP